MEINIDFLKFQKFPSSQDDMASRKRPHDSTTNENGLNHEMEGITIKNGSESIKVYRPVRIINYLVLKVHRCFIKYLLNFNMLDFQILSFGHIHLLKI